MTKDSPDHNKTDAIDPDLAVYTTVPWGGLLKYKPAIVRAYQIFRYVALAGIVVFIFTRLSQDIGSIDWARPAFSITNIFLAFLFTFLAFAFHVGIWIEMIRKSGWLAEGAGLYCVKIWFHSYLHRYVPGKLMLVSERVRSSKTIGIPANAVISLTSWETVLSFFSAAIVMMFFLVFGLTGNTDNSNAIIALGAVALLAAALLIVWRLFLRFPVAKKFNFREIAKFKLRDNVILIGMLCCYWIFFSAAIFVIAKDFMPIGMAAFPMIAFWHVASIISGVILVVAPAGLFVREGVLATGLSQIMPIEDAIVLAVTARIWFTAIEFVFYSLSALVKQPSQSR